MVNWRRFFLVPPFLKYVYIQVLYFNIHVVRRSFILLYTQYAGPLIVFCTAWLQQDACPSHTHLPRPCRHSLLAQRRHPFSTPPRPAPPPLLRLRRCPPATQPRPLVRNPSMAVTKKLLYSSPSAATPWVLGVRFGIQTCSPLDWLYLRLLPFQVDFFLGPISRNGGQQMVCSC